MKCIKSYKVNKHIEDKNKLHLNTPSKEPPYNFYHYLQETDIQTNSCPKFDVIILMAMK